MFVSSSFNTYVNLPKKKNINSVWVDNTPRFLKETYTKTIKTGSLIVLKREKDLLNFFIGYRNVEGRTLRVR
jgi:hypothetical protein